METVPEPSLLSVGITLVYNLPLPPPSARLGRPAVHCDGLFLKALVIIVVKRLPRFHALLKGLRAATLRDLRLVEAILRKRGIP